MAARAAKEKASVFPAASVQTTGDVHSQVQHMVRRVVSNGQQSCLDTKCPSILTKVQM